jgi:hypothetical protein
MPFYEIGRFVTVGTIARRQLNPAQNPYLKRILTYFPLCCVIFMV